eukprot:Phypoly_transcript_19117.p1 GENE.Phypoly_transcript_19117~~Phypoly_transcript_19117.p1  ORF type:complete len:208 (+),score=26.78 Phypoly_transcript_19117:65-688(+)
MQHLQNLNSTFPVQNWNEFLELARFGKPDFTNLEHLGDRVLANLEYYSGNYLWVLVFLSSLACINDGNLLLAVLGIAVVYFLLFIAQKEPLTLGETTLTWKQQHIAFAILSATLIYYASGLILLRYLAYGMLFVIIHAVTRKRSVKSKMNYAIKANLSSTSLTSSLSKVADKIVNAGDELNLTETVTYNQSVPPALRSRLSQNLSNK